MKWICIGYLSNLVEYDYDFIEASEEDAYDCARRLARNLIEENDEILDEIWQQVEADIEERPSLSIRRDELFDEYIEDECKCKIVQIKNDVNLAELGKMNLPIDTIINSYRKI
jgi:hypothetical protein